MSADQTALAELNPTAGADRISSVDSLRGFALLGILLLNVVGFGLPFAYEDPTIAGGSEGLNGLAWWINTLLFEGTMRSLFSILFGAGVILLTSRAEQRGGGVEVADIYFRRTMWLMAFGLVHSWLLLFQGDILYIYGATGLFLFVFRHLDGRKLVALGVLVLMLYTVQFVAEYFDDLELKNQAAAAQLVVDETGSVDEEQQGALDAWQEFMDRWTATPEEIDEIVSAYRGSYVEHVRFNADELVRRQTTGLLKYSLWDAMSFMLIGMGLFKLGVLSGKRSNRFYGVLLAAGYGVGLTINGFEMAHTMTASPGDIAGELQYFTYDLGRLFVALGHLSLVVLFCKNGLFRGLMKRLAAVGQMALTNYIMHTVICAVFFFGFAFYNKLERHELYYLVFGIWVLQLFASPIWLRHFRFGPLEWLWRSLTYQTLQPFRR